MVNIRRASAAVLMAALCTSGSLWADDGNASTASNGQKGLFELNSAETLCKGQWAFSAYYNMWDRRVTSVPGYDPLWTNWDLEVERTSGAIGYGVSNKFEISLMLPHWSYEAHNAMPPMFGVGYLNGRYFGNGNIDQSGLGDLRLGGKYQVHRSATSAFAITAYVDLPTGDDDEAVVTGDTGFGAGFAWSNESGWVVNASYRVPGDSDFSDDTEFGGVADEIHGGIGYARDITDRFQWITELSGISYQGGDADDHDAADLATGGRVRFGNPDWAFNFAARVSDRSEIGGLVGVSYAPRNRFYVRIEKPVAKGANGREYPGTGTVTSEDGEINCGTVCEAKYRCGDVVALTAAADADSRFVGWDGACGGDAGSVTLTVEGEDLTCGATFIRQYDAQGQVGFKKHPDEGFYDGAGTLTMSWTGGPGTGSEDCSTANCKEVTERLDGGATVTFEAKPDARSTVEWSGDCAGKTGNSVSLTLEKDTSCGVTFVGPPPVKANLTLLIRGSGSGSVTSTPPSRDNVSSCGTDCLLRYIGPEAVQIQLEAKPDAGSTFAGWSGACTGVGPTVPLTMDVDKTCVAIFTMPIKDQVACGGRGKKGVAEAASCETRVEAISFGGDELPADFWPTKRNGGKPKNGTLCEVAQTLAQCPAVQACISGSRANEVRRFLGAQNDSLKIGWERYRVAEDCGTGAPASGVAATVVIEKATVKQQ
jgi:hypothetical protein